MWRTAFGVLMVAHGLLTIVISTPRPSADAPMDTSCSIAIRTTLVAAAFRDLV